LPKNPLHPDRDDGGPQLLEVKTWSTSAVTGGVVVHLGYFTLAWEDLSAVDRRALTEMLVDKIERHPSKVDKDGKRHYTVPLHPIPRSLARG
jgi:hypothetical protein